MAGAPILGLADNLPPGIALAFVPQPDGLGILPLSPRARSSAVRAADS